MMARASPAAARTKAASLHHPGDVHPGARSKTSRHTERDLVHAVSLSPARRPSQSARTVAMTPRRPHDHCPGRQATQTHPVVVAQRASRAAKAQLRIADAITAFAGSMRFVYIHAVLFAVWMLVVEKNPWPKLTLIVSLEAIFLSTFVMIGQNRAAAFQQAKADHDFNEQELELKTNTEITRAIHTLTTELHNRLLKDGGS